MKAAILVELNKPLVIDDVSLPQSLKYGQVLVRVMSSGICGSQLGEISGAKGPDKYLPHLLGHEGGGIVENIGEGVTKIKEGDHVVMHWRKGLGIESETPKYKLGQKDVNAGWVTTFNEYAVVSENRLTPIAKHISFDEAALLGCGLTTGFGIVNNDAKLKIGESVAIFGIGSVGLNVVQGASMVSAYPIIAIDIHDHKLELAKKYGATHIINAATQDVEQEIRKIVGANGVDAAIDNTGNTSIIEIAYQITSGSGRTILVGVPKSGDKATFFTLPLHFEKKLLGSHGGESIPHIDIPNYLKLIDAKKLQVKDMVTHYYSLDDINIALSDMKNGKIGKCIISFS